MIDRTATGGLRSVLEEHAANLRAEIVEQGGDPDSDAVAPDIERGLGDSALGSEERSRLLSVMGALRDSLRDVERALRKMDLGTYGICERCGNPIATERLEALPWAILCIDCKREGEGR